MFDLVLDIAIQLQKLVAIFKRQLILVNSKFY